MYHTIHPDNSAKGGSAVIVKENITHFEEEKYQTEEIQATSIQVQTKNYYIVITGLYCPPKHLLKKNQYIDFLKRLGKRFILGGDFNAKNIYWGSRLTTTKGKELLSAIREHGCEPLSTGKPTYWPTDPAKIPDLIDFFIIKNISSNFMKVEESYEMNSDHSPILLTLSENIIEKEKNPILINKDPDWESFRICLELKINLDVSLQTRKCEKILNI